MNEEYIKSFRKSPDSLLLGRIHARLEKRERTDRLKRYSLLSMLTLTLMFGLLMTFSSTVRADVIHTIEEIAHLRYEVTSNYPGNSDEEVVTLKPEYLSWEDASSRFQSSLPLPAYAPQGYARLAEIEFFVWGDGSPYLRVTWKKPNHPIILLHITQCQSGSPSCGLIVGNGALEEITLNGKPAVLIRGAWNSDTQQYDLSAGIDIQWRYDENTVYQLTSGNEDLLGELLKMAESIP